MELSLISKREGEDFCGVQKVRRKNSAADFYAGEDRRREAID